MTQYFFRLSECGTVTEDEEGRAFVDLVAARNHAVINARDIMSAEVKEGRLCLSCRIDVLDVDGLVVSSVPFRELVAVTGL